MATRTARAAIDPEDEAGALRGNIKVTRDDWIALATDVLIAEGVEKVKILTLSERLQVSRSSFYWYFKSRQALLNALLDVWQRTNTRRFVDACDAGADSITGAVCNLFRCFVDSELFDPKLDFAIREWSRRSKSVRKVVDRADKDRLGAVAGMFERYDYPPGEAEVRARILYYMQIGYYALELKEPLEKRLSYLGGYLLGFTGEKASIEEIEAFSAYARAASKRVEGVRSET